MKNNMLQNNRFKFFNELKIVQMYILGYIFDMHGFSVWRALRWGMYICNKEISNVMMIHRPDI
jgi:hypothetical protein